MRGFFNPTHHGGLKKSNPTQPITGVQPNPTQPTWIGLGQVEPMGWAVFIFIIIFLLLLLLNWAEKKYISLATWVNQQNIHELVFQLSYKQNIYELVSQFSYKQIGVEWESESGRR